MNWILWILLSIVLICVIILVGLYIYFKIFSLKLKKADKEVVRILKDGLLESFRENKEYEEIKEEYFNFIDSLDVFSDYVHFKTLYKEKDNDRRNDYLTVQYLQEDGKKIARIHFRAFPIKSLKEKFKPKQAFYDGFKLAEVLLDEQKDLDCVELISHNKLLSKSIVKTVIERYDLKLNYYINDNFEIEYLPWIYSEWAMINENVNLKSKEGYSKLRKINKTVYVKLTRL